MNDTHRILSQKGFHFIGCCVPCRVYAALQKKTLVHGSDKENNPLNDRYVNRGHNNRYQYLLVVNPKYVPEEPCTIPGHPTIHPDT